MGRPSKAELQARGRAADPRPVPMSYATARTVSQPSASDDPRRTPPPAVPVDSHGVPVFDPLLTADQVAFWLGKPKNTLYAWRTRGLGPRGIKVGGDLRYRRSDVEAYIEENADPRDIA